MATAPAIERAPLLRRWCRYVPGFARRPGGTERSTEYGLRLSYSLEIDAPADSLALRFRNENFWSIGAPAPRPQYNSVLDRKSVVQGKTVRRSRREDSVTRTRRRSASSRSWRSDPPAGAIELGGRWQQHPPSNERRYCAGGAAMSPDSRAVQVALNDQQNMAFVYHIHWKSMLPLTLSLSDSETKIFGRLARQRRAPNTIPF